MVEQFNMHVYVFGFLLAVLLAEQVNTTPRTMNFVKGRSVTELFLFTSAILNIFKNTRVFLKHTTLK